MVMDASSLHHCFHQKFVTLATKDLAENLFNEGCKYSSVTAGQKLTALHFRVHFLACFLEAREIRRYTYMPAQSDSGKTRGHLTLLTSLSFWPGRGGQGQSSF